MSLPLLPSVNLAPTKPLLSLADKEPQPSYICDGLTELLKDILGRDSELWRLVAETTETTSNFIQGKQIYQRTSSGWTIQNLKRTDPNKISCINTMQYYCTQNMQRLTSSNPDIEPAEEFRQVSLKDKVKKNKAVWNGYERRFYNTWFNHQESLHAIISGTYIESVQYDHLAQGAKVFKEVWGEREVPISDGKGQCFNCPTEAPYDKFQGEIAPQCPECGSYNVHAEAPVSQLIPSVVGIQPIQTGDLTLKLIPIQASRFNPKVQVEESSYFLERVRVSKGRLNQIIGRNIEWGEPVSDKGLDSIDSIAKAGNTLFGEKFESAPQNSKDITIDRLSLKPEDYGHIASKGEETLSGNLPAGKLTDIFPDGMTVMIANQKTILGIYPNVHHSQEVSSGVYHMRLGSGIGRGSEDEVEIEKRFNRADAQMLRAGESAATPAHWAIEGAVDRKHLKQIGMPGTVIPIKSGAVSQHGTTELIGQIQPANVAGTYFQYNYEILDKYRQMTAHAPDVTNNLTGANRSGTATEAQISDANSEALYGPILQMKAAVRVSTAKKTIALYAKHFKGVSKFFTHGTTKQNIAVGENIKGEDVDPEIEFVVVANSERPKSRYTQQSAMATILQLVGADGLVMLKAQAPELLDNILDTWDIDLSIDDYDLIEDICFKRLTQALDVAQQYQNEVQGQLPLIPEILLLGIKPQICPEEPYHVEKAKWFSEYLDTPDAQELDENQRGAIKALIMAHRNGGVQQEGNIMAAQNEAQVIGSEPLMEQQNEQMAQQAQMQAGATAQEQQGQQMQNQHEASQNEAQLADNEAQRAHDAQMAASGQSHEQAMANDEKDFALHEMDHETNIEKMRAKKSASK